MIKRTLLLAIFIILTYGFWVSPDFKEIAAGVAIFLFGMLALEEGFKVFTGGTLERFLRVSTSNLWKSLGFGVISTTLMQSSSLVSVITISFLSAGLIDLTAGIGIIFGANLGTTTGAWLVAAFGLKVKISAYAMPMLVFGVILIFQKSARLRGIGYIFAGLGFLFLGIHYMKEGFEAFKETINLVDYAVGGYPGLFLFVAIGVFATVVMQSSHATLVLILAALATQQITYENGLALAIGSNVGTTITAIIGSLSANAGGKRLAGAHLIFNVTTGIVAIILIHPLIAAVDSISAAVGIADDDYTLKLAVFHTLFNLMGVIMMIPLIGRLVSFLEGFIKSAEVEFDKPMYLSEASAELSEVAVEAVRKETLRLYDNAISIISHGISLRRSDLFSDEDLNQVVASSRKVFDEDLDDLYERRVKALYGEILGFISEAQVRLEPHQRERLFQHRQAGRDLVEAIKGIKHLRKNLRNALQSSNPHLQAEYDRIRYTIALVLRDLNRFRNAKDEDTDTVLSLDASRMNLKSEDIITSGALDRLIHARWVTTMEATSLINDHSYCQQVCENLLQMGKTLFVSSNASDRAAIEMLSLSDEEIESALTESATGQKE